MNKFIKKQLESCRVASIPEYNDDTTQIIIKKKCIPSNSDIGLQLGDEFDIEVENYILYPSATFNLHDNWNNGIIPTDKQMHVRVIQLMGKMVKVEATGINDKEYWSGWLPKKSFKII